MLQARGKKERYEMLPDAMASGEMFCGKPLGGMLVWIPATAKYQSQLSRITDASQASAFDAPHGHAHTSKSQTFAGVPRVTFDEKCIFCRCCATDISPKAPCT